MSEIESKILRAAGESGEGVSLSKLLTELEASTTPGLSRRTLQRRLAQLVNVGKLDRVGRGRSVRYKTPAHTPASVAIQGQLHSLERSINLSEQGSAVRAAVRAPIQVRAPVGFNRNFLERYRPNETFYLPRATRDELARMGSLPGSNQPAGTFARTIYHRLLVDLSYNSSRLEGNTYTLLETKRLLQLGRSADDKDAREAQMILNHKSATDLLVEQTADVGFNRYTVLNLHAMLSDNLLGDPMASGRLRSEVVDIEGTSYHPLAVPQLIEECFQQILDTANAIGDPFEQAFFVMVHIPYLQPFIDVNKRVSRLAANIPFFRNNLCPLSFVDVPVPVYIDGLLGVYELNDVALLRDVFVWAYSRSSARYSAIRQSLGEPDRFRMAYHDELYRVVRDVVVGSWNRDDTIRTLPDLVKDSSVRLEDRPRFIELVENELIHLHEGNIARFRLLPSEYRAWKEEAGWESDK